MNYCPFSSIKGTYYAAPARSDTTEPGFHIPCDVFLLFLADGRGSAILIGALSLPGFCTCFPRESPILVCDAGRCYFGLRNHREDTISRLRGPSLAGVIAAMNKVVCVCVRF